MYVDPSALKSQKMILSPKFAFSKFHRGINIPFTKVLCSVKCKVFKQFPSVERALESEFQRTVEV